ncbi:O-antigen ligase [Caulobacter sp. 17J80-11]|uniref:O-antigen ligase family protein n=1 Tax=Caulobacter sp. 17J80-11 TaxID=2763502 RepID=UPI0016539A5A|nr:O-antigen ligase family protein [Caulobacter sp. 17J80-11]MBC6982479.1 O-antigen ligase family protein [Caulobacter sp. 17J80-11]
MPAVFRTRAFTAKSLDFQVALKLASVGLCAVVMIWLAPRLFKILKSPAGLLWTGFVLAVAFSVPSSMFPMVSTAAVFTMISALLFPSLAVSTIGEETAARTAILVLGLFCAISLVIFFTSSTFGRLVASGRLGGLAGHPKAAAQLAGYCIILAMIYFARTQSRLSRTVIAVSGALAAAVLILSDSRTPLLALALVSTLWLLRKRPKLQLLGVSAAACLVALVLMNPHAADLLNHVSRTGDSSEVLQLNGRNKIWPMAWALSWERPLTGWGYGASSLILPSYSSAMGFLPGYVAPHAHNMFLHVLFSSGVFAAAFCVLAFVATVAQAVALRHLPAICLLIFAFVTGLTESTPFLGSANFDTVGLGLGIGLVLASAAKRQMELRRPFSGQAVGAALAA